MTRDTVLDFLKCTLECTPDIPDIFVFKIFINESLQFTGLSDHSSRYLWGMVIILSVKYLVPQSLETSS